MFNFLKPKARSVFEVAITFVPWIVSMYVLFWLESGEIWTSETAHRGKLSVMILVLGMGLSFVVYSGFIKYHQKQDVVGESN